MSNPKIQYRVRGPLFDGRARRALAMYVEEVKAEIAFQGLADVHFEADRMLRHPTPYWETQLQIEHVRQDIVVNDSDVIYGPWLEGTGSRNKTTRFKGYWIFRRVTQALRRKAPAIAQHVLVFGGTLRRMNGGI